MYNDVRNVTSGPQGGKLDTRWRCVHVGSNSRLNMERIRGCKWIGNEQSSSGITALCHLVVVCDIQCRFLHFQFWSRAGLSRHSGSIFATSNEFCRVDNAPSRWQDSHMWLVGGWKSQWQRARAPIQLRRQSELRPICGNSGGSLLDTGHCCRMLEGTAEPTHLARVERTQINAYVVALHSYMRIYDSQPWLFLL